MKKSEILAIENVKKINAVLRTERNDALAIVQECREDASRLKEFLDEAVLMLKDVRDVLMVTDADGNTQLNEKIDQFLDKVTDKT